MKIILPLITLVTLSGCGLLPPPNPVMSKVVEVSKEKSGKTITLHQKIVRSDQSGKFVQLPAGIYTHTATGAGYYYFKAPKPINYLNKASSEKEGLSTAGGIAISKTMMQPCYVYMEEEPDTVPSTRMWTWMLGMEFISEEGDVWWKRNY